MIVSKKGFLVVLAATGLRSVVSECPNACSGHGQCGSYDMCTCDRNWQGADCSLRTCPFGLAHIDTPKGDLDASNSIGNHDDILVQSSNVYPYGTTEGFPYMVDTQGNVQANTAHEYAECSSKGLCDRKTGMCECLPGYDGTACQRASCPSAANINTDAIKNFNKAVKDFSSVAKDNTDINSLITTSRTGSGSSFVGRATTSSTTAQTGECSGHGTCETISKLAFLEHGNVYSLWDKDSTMGCLCDSGYSGPDCSEMMCPYGVDPLYIDDTTARVTQTSVRFQTSDSNALSGTYAIKFYDVFGEDYLTRPIELSPTGVINGVNHCEDVVTALKALPNRVVKDVACNQAAINTNYGFEYTLTFINNPGELAELELNEHLDGSRPTVSVSAGTYTSTIFNKVNGEFVDYFPDRCEGLTVKVLADSADADNSWTLATVRPGSLGYLSGKNGPLSTAEKRILRRCLGDSDWDSDNNVDVANWDEGVVIEASGTTPDLYPMIGAFPHAVKVVPVETSAGYNKLKPGKYHLVWYDATATDKEFRVANINGGQNLPSEATESYVFTTKGTVQQMGWGTDSQISNNQASGASSTRIVGYFDKGSNKIYTNYDTSCENQPSLGARNHVCIEKGAKLFVVDGCWGAGDLGAGTVNPIFGGTAVYNCADSTRPSYNTGNIYTVTKVYTIPLAADSDTSPSTTIDISSDPTLKKYVNTHIIEVAGNLPWSGLMGDPENSNTAGDDTMWSDNTGVVTLFHFTPYEEGSYQYVSQCSNRGLCDTGSGLCQCFKGYTGEDCSIQSALAK